MPIRLTCSACNKPMQAPDTAAGKRVKCPNCQAVVSVPAAAPAAPPPSARPAAPPVPPPAPQAAVPPPPAPAAAAAAAAPANDNPFGFDDAPVKKPKAASRADRDEDEDERPSKKRGRDRRDRDDRDDDEDWEGEAPRKGAKGWAAFGSGCGSVKIGLWIEFAAITYFAIIMFLALAGVGGRGSPGGALFLPTPLLMLAGTSLILMGRLKMMSAPKSTGAGTVLLGAVLLTGLRGIAVLAGALFSVLAVANDGMAGAMYASRAGMALVIGAAPGAVAELTVVVAMALAGGCIPDENLRRKSGLLTFVTQMCALAYFVLVTLVLLVGLDDLAPGPRGPRGPRGPGGPPIDPQTLIFIILLVYLLLQFVYTALQVSMYGAAQTAIAGYNRRKPKFEDEE